MAKPPVLSKKAIVILPIGLVLSLVMLIGGSSYEPEPGTNKPVPGTTHHVGSPWIALVVALVSLWLSLPRLRSATRQLVSRLIAVFRTILAGVSFVILLLVGVFWLVGAIVGVFTALGNGGAEDWVGVGLWVGLPLLLVFGPEAPPQGAMGPHPQSGGQPNGPEFSGWDPVSGRYVPGQSSPSTPETNGPLF